MILFGQRWRNLGVSRTTGSVTPTLNFDAGLTTFTPSAAKRNSAGPFAAGLMSQGNWPAGASPDNVQIDKGVAISGQFNSNFDFNQGTIVFWITPEWNGNDSRDHAIICGTPRFFYFSKTGTNLWFFALGNKFSSRSSIGIVSGSTYFVVLRWDTKNTLDGTNHFCISVDDTHSFGVTEVPTVQAISSYSWGVDTQENAYPLNALLEGETIYRRPLFDGTNGIDVGNGDEIAQIYNAGAGKDPTEITGIWDVCFCLPTNASVGALATGTGNAWSHPHSSNLITPADGFMMSTVWANWSAEGTPINPAVLATSEKIWAGGYKFESDAVNEGYYFDVTVSAGNDWAVRALAHSDGTSQPKIILYDQTNTAEIGSLIGTTTSTRTAPDVFNLTGEAPAGCTTLRVKCINVAASGTCYWHQVGVYANLWDDPSFEAGTAPTNVGTPTTSEQSAEQAHSDTNSWKVISDAADEGISRSITVTSGKYYHVSGWVYAATSGTVDMDVTGGSFQDGSTTIVTSSGNDAWKYLRGLVRATSTTLVLRFLSNAAQTFYVDDVAVVATSDVSLTVTPASQANSDEASGRRVDGRDKLPQPTANNTATAGGYAVKVTPRHAIADVAKFGQTQEYVFEHYEDASNYVFVRREANLVRLTYQANGAGEQTGTWNATGAWPANTQKLIEVAYGATNATLKVDSVTQITIAGAVAFAADWTANVRWGTDLNDANQLDGTLTAP